MFSVCICLLCCSLLVSFLSAPALSIRTDFCESSESLSEQRTVCKRCLGRRRCLFFAFKREALLPQYSEVRRRRAGAFSFLFYMLFKRTEAVISGFVCGQTVPFLKVGYRKGI